jgi:hypothetical protein
VTLEISLGEVWSEINADKYAEQKIKHDMGSQSG